MIWRSPIWKELAFGVLTLAWLVPLWSVRYPPFQDFPQYAALTRTLADYGDPTLGFRKLFELNFDTYTLFAPWLGALLGKLFDPVVAAKLVVSLGIIATPWGARELLRVLGRPTAYAGFVLPLAYNAQVMMGFVSYTLGVALMLAGLVLGVQLLERRSLGRQVALCLVGVACLYSHVVPFAFMALGLGLAALASAEPRRLLATALPLVPAGLLGAVGYGRDSTGWNLLPSSVGGAARPNCPIYDDTRVTFEALPGWLTDVFASQWDERLLLGLFIAGLVIVIFGASFGPAAAPGRTRRVHVCIALLAPLGLALYFVMPRTCAWIWPIHARFLVVGAYLSVLLLPPLPRRAAAAVGVGLALVSLLATVQTRRGFAEYAEVIGDFESALAAIPPGQKVASLTVDKAAPGLRIAAFHHFGAYYQAERGGLAQFSFATMHHWPVRIRPSLGLLEPTYAFQFDPLNVQARQLDFADYVLVRGFVPPAVASGTFHAVYGGERWRVFARTRPP